MKAGWPHAGQYDVVVHPKANIERLDEPGQCFITEPGRVVEGVAVHCQPSGQLGIPEEIDDELTGSSYQRWFLLFHRWGNG